MNPDRGKTEEKRKEEPRRTQTKCKVQLWKRTVKFPCLFPRLWTHLSRFFFLKFVTASDSGFSTKKSFKDDTDTSNPPDDNQTAEWLARKWESAKRGAI